MTKRFDAVGAPEKPHAHGTGVAGIRTPIWESKVESLGSNHDASFDSRPWGPRQLELTPPPAPRLIIFIGRIYLNLTEGRIMPSR